MSAPFYEGTGPLVSDRFINTFIAGEDLALGVLVEFTADFTVKKTVAVNSKKVVGLTYTAAVNGAKVSVVCRGLCRAKAYGAITAGDQLCSGPTAPGTVKSDTATLNTTIIGTAAQGIASGATGLILLW